MTPDDYGKITYMIINQKGITAQGKLDLIYKFSLLMGGMQGYNPENLKVVLTQEKTTQEVVHPEDFSARIHGKDSVKTS